MDIEIYGNCNEIIQFRNRKSNYKTIDMANQIIIFFCENTESKGNSIKYGYTRKK